MKAKTTPAWRLAEEDRAQLRNLISAVPRDADETDPHFVELLSYWEACRVPWNARPTVPAYRAHGDKWVTGGVAAVVLAIKAHCGDTACDHPLVALHAGGEARWKLCDPRLVLMGNLDPELAIRAEKARREHWPEVTRRKE